MSGKKSNIYLLAESAMMASLSMAIFVVSDFIPWPSFLQGGSVTLFGQVPIILLSYRRGLKCGIPAAFVLALFELFMGISNFSYVKTLSAYVTVALFDYIIAFGCLGLGGIFRSIKGKTAVKLVCGAVLVCFIRYGCHFISGVTVWRDYTQSLTASVIYSLTYNASYMVPETVITVIGVLAAVKFAKTEKAGK